MSMNEVCELSSILYGDDVNKSEIERKIIMVNTAIDQQESRLQHEEDQRQISEKLENNLIQKADNINDSIDVTSILLTQMLKDENINDKIIDFLMKVINYEDNKTKHVNDINNLLEIVNNLEERIQDIEKLKSKYNKKHLNEIESTKSHSENNNKSLLDDVNRLENENIIREQELSYLDNSIKRRNENIDDVIIVQRNIINSITDSNNMKIEVLQNESNYMDSSFKNLQNKNMENEDTLSQSVYKAEIYQSYKQNDLNLDVKIMSLRNINEGIKSNISEIQKQKTDTSYINSDIQIKIRSNEERINSLTALENHLCLQIDREKCRFNSFNERNKELNNELLKNNNELNIQLKSIEIVKNNIILLKLQVSGNHPDIAAILEGLEQSYIHIEDLFQQLLQSQNINSSLIIKNDELEDNVTAIMKVYKETKENSNTLQQNNKITLLDYENTLQENTNLGEIDNLKQILDEQIVTNNNLSSKYSSLNEYLLNDANENEKLNIELNDLRSKQTNKFQKEAEKILNNQLDQRIHLKRLEIINHHKLAIEKLKIDLYDSDTKFKETFFKTEKDLNNSEVEAMEELKFLEQMYVDLQQENYKLLNDVREEETTINKNINEPLHSKLPDESLEQSTSHIEKSKIESNQVINDTLFQDFFSPSSSSAFTPQNSSSFFKKRKFSPAVSTGSLFKLGQPIVNNSTNKQSVTLIRDPDEENIRNSSSKITNTPKKGPTAMPVKKALGQRSSVNTNNQSNSTPKMRAKPKHQPSSSK